jgi:hypothetical protein
MQGNNVRMKTSSRLTAARLLAGLLGCAAMLAAGCGGGEGETGTGPAPDEPPPPATTETQEASQRFSAGPFRPRFTAEVPASWQPVEDPAMVQFFSGETSQRALTVSSALAGTPVAQAVSRLRGAPNLGAMPAKDATVGGAQGQTFDASVTSGYSTDLPGIDYLVVEDFQIRVWVVDVKGETVVVIADSPVAESEGYLAEVDRVLETLKFRG